MCSISQWQGRWPTSPASREASRRSSGSEKTTRACWSSSPSPCCSAWSSPSSLPSVRSYLHHNIDIIDFSGLIYFVLKYLCDKHNLAGVYYPSEIDETLHRSAINIVVFAATFQQIYLTVLAFTRREPDEPWFPPPARFVVLCVILALELLIFFAQAFSGFCHKISPIK